MSDTDLDAVDAIDEAMVSIDTSLLFPFATESDERTPAVSVSCRLSADHD